MTTINPADCDRTTVYAGECRNFADTEWIRFDSGRRRSPDARDGNTWLIDVAYGSFWMADDKVRNLVPLVPGRDFSGVDWKTMYDQARSERDAAVYAYDKAARERDKEEASRREAWKHLDKAADRVVHEQTRAQEAERERDEWKARAEAAERELADEYSEANQKAAAWDRVAAHPALRLLPEADHTYAGAVLERITWLAEAAEARTAPAVTRADIEKCVYGSRRAGRECDKRGFVPVHVQEAVGQLCNLLGIEAERATDSVEDAIRNGLNVWGTTEEGVRQIAESVRRAISNDGGENVL